MAKWCWSVADRGLGYSLCLCFCLVRIFRLSVKCAAKWRWSVAVRGIGYSLCLFVSC